MKIRNSLIICLAVIGVLLFGTVQFVIIPDNLQKQKQYELEQQDPVHHDLSSILKNKSKYMGDASNIINLFGTLPLNNHKIEYQLYPDKFQVELNYDASVESVGETILTQALVYNSTAAFALIDNLKVINYNFGDSRFWVFREDITKWYGKDPKMLLDKDEWKNNVQGKLKNRQYSNDFVEAVVMHANSRK